MDNTTLIRQIQLEKVKGELRALKASYYNPIDAGNIVYKTVAKLIDDIIYELDNELG